MGSVRVQDGERGERGDGDGVGLPRTWESFWWSNLGALHFSAVTGLLYLFRGEVLSFNNRFE